jgi:hypothetical protein
MKKQQQYETSAKIAMVSLIGIVLSLTIYIGIGKHDIEEVEAIAHTPAIWIPSNEDQAYMDSLYSIDAVTKADMDSIRVMIDAILDKLE